LRENFATSRAGPEREPSIHWIFWNNSGGMGFAKGDLEIRVASCEDPFGCPQPARMKKKT
jgi:hypothetical protein